MTSLRAAYAQFQTLGGIADLSARLELILTGADRVRYLNGQVTCNVAKLSNGQTQPACVTTAKGRLCAEIVIAAAADALHIDADPTLRSTLPTRLERYIISDDATLTDVTDSRVLLHFLGPPPPEIPGTTCIPCRRFGRDGWDVRLAASALADKKAALFSERPTLDPELIETLRIEAGIPRWGAELDEDTLPPEAGLDRTHIDYHKPSDTADKINYEDLDRVADFAVALASRVGDQPEALAFAKVQQAQDSGGGRAGVRIFTGTIPDYATDVKGLLLGGVIGGGPAEQAGLQKGDVIVQIGEQTIANIYDYTYALEALKVNVAVKLVYMRGTERKETTLTPSARK